MLVAIIVAVLAAVVVIVAVAAALALRARKETPSVGRAKGVSELSTVGVGSSPFERRSKAQAAREGDVTVASSEPGAASKKPSDELGRRFAGLAAAAVAIFGALSAKLWSMQIAGSEAYAQAAEENLYTTVKTPAPRGCIYDTNGEALVVNRPSQTVVADPEVADNRDVVRRLSTVLGLPANVVLQRINDAAAGAQSLRVVGEDVRLRDVAFIAEHADAFPGITVEERSQREYPYGALAAHVLGYTSMATPESLENQAAGRDVLAIDTIGSAGVEATYDAYLSGEHGESQVMVDANGRRISVMSDIKDTKGNDLYLTIDARAQYVADAALAKLIAPSGGVIGTGKGSKGAVVALDVTDGSVLVMASFPTFDPTNFTGSIPTELWDKYQEKGAYAPLNNNVVSGQFMAASTFKAFTSLAGLEYGFATEGSSWNCTGKWDGFGTGDVQRCWKHDGHGDARSARGHRELLRHGLLRDRQGFLRPRARRHRRDIGDGAPGLPGAVRLRREDRHRFGRRGRGRHPHTGLEGRALAERALRGHLPRRRLHQYDHRPGRRARDSFAGGLRLRRRGHGPHHCGPIF